MIHPPQQLRAVIYTRVSSDEQTKGYGLEYQLEDCRRAIAQHGHRLIRVYSDPGISGTVEDRPGLNELRRDAQQGQFDVVYFWKSDRLARDEILQLTLYREFRRLGLETCSVSEPNMNDLMRGIYAVFGAEDLRNIKAKTYSGRLRAMRAGKWMGPPPYGYVKDSEFKLIANPPEAAAVRQLFEWLVADRLSLYALAKRAYEHQIPTRFDNQRVTKPHNGSGYWSAGTLRVLIRRGYYATGQARIKVRPELGQVSRPRTASGASEEILISIPPLISLDLFERAQEQLRHNAEYSSRAMKRTYLFAKKLRCGFCGLKFMAMSSGKGGQKYYRGNFQRERPCRRCGCRPERTLDDALWTRIVSFFSNPNAFLGKLEAYRTRNSQLPHIRTEEAALKRKEESMFEQEKALLTCQLEKFYAPEILVAKKRELEALRNQVSERRNELRRRALSEERRATTVASASVLYQAIRDKLESPSYATKTELYKLLINKIVLFGNKAEVWLNVPLTAPEPLTNRTSVA